MSLLDEYEPNYIDRDPPSKRCWRWIYAHLFWFLIIDSLIVATGVASAIALFFYDEILYGLLCVGGVILAIVLGYVVTCYQQYESY